MDADPSFFQSSRVLGDLLQDSLSVARKFGGRSIKLAQEDVLAALYFDNIHYVEEVIRKRRNAPQDFSVLESLGLIDNNQKITIVGKKFFEEL